MFLEGCGGCGPCGVWGTVPLQLLCRWRDAVAPVLAKAYLQLGLPKSEMILSAKRRPEWTASLRRHTDLAVTRSASMSLVFYDNKTQ